MVAIRDKLIANLPIRKGPLTIRLWKRTDVDYLAEWPPYRFPYEAFNLFILGTNSKEKRNEYFLKHDSNESRIYIIVDHIDCKGIGFFFLVDCNWDSGIVGNMGIRIRPDWCNKGIGTNVLLMLCDWGFGNGLKKIRLDVAAPNLRAIRCYEKAGFKRVGEFWRDDPNLPKYDLDKLENASVPIKLHVKFDEKIPQLRFFWMEAVCDERWAASANSR